MGIPSDIWKSPVIKQRLAQEATFECEAAGISQKPQYWVMVPQADDRQQAHILKNYEAGIQHVDPHEMQQEFAKQIQAMLQEEVAFDGMWLVGWTHPPTTYEVLVDSGNCWSRLIMIWHDEHGDPQYTVESDTPFVEMMENGELYYVNMCVEAHETWKPIYSAEVLKEDMGLKDDQQRALAQEALKH